MDWTVVFPIVAVVVSLPYLIGPAVIKMALRIFGEPKVDLLGELPVPERATEMWARVDPEMAALGFASAPALRVQAMESMWILCRVYAKPADKEIAMAAVMYRGQKGQVIAAGQHVEFSCDFGTDGSVTTNNSKEVGFEAPSPDRTVVRAPAVQEVKALYAMHKEACRKFGYGVKRPMPTGEWWVTGVRESLQKYGRRMCNAGYMYESPRGDYALTWKGALLGTYQNLFPWKQVRRRRMDAVVEELRRAGRV